MARSSSSALDIVQKATGSAGVLVIKLAVMWSQQCGITKRATQQVWISHGDAFFCHGRKCHSEQSSIGHNVTSRFCRQQQSQHFALIAARILLGLSRAICAGERGLAFETSPESTLRWYSRSASVMCVPVTIPSPVVDRLHLEPLPHWKNDVIEPDSRSH